jgi:hypothetical protein
MKARLLYIPRRVITATAALLNTLVDAYDISLGIVGYTGALVALTALFGWAWALLAGSLALIALAMVVPD